MSYDAESDLKYIESVDDIPLTGPDLWEGDSDAKLDAAETAESKLEADVNDGVVIGDATTLHAKAANAYASYLLFIGPEHPEDALSGQMYGGAGDDTMEFATEVHDVYRSLRSSIEGSDADSSQDTTEFVL
ncbi:hypothetical protein ACFQMF_01490 [Halorubrum rutilum]|uniref:Uncharacterized protein n=1 Tax=Halorubrum rutilum TaxID=1364933 RepID=A0ABD6AG62_9EURY|nr:hypothetical protein [Halorubrum rutilum]